MADRAQAPGRYSGWVGAKVSCQAQGGIAIEAAALLVFFDLRLREWTNDP